MRRLASIAAALALAPGCTTVAELPVSLATAQVTSDFESYDLQRVGLVPFVGEDLDHSSGRMLQSTFFSEISQSTPFEVVLLNQIDLAEIPGSQPYRRGWYDPRTIIEISARFKLDALLVGTVTRHQRYPPQVLSIGLEMVSAETGLILWNAGIHLDASDRRVRESLEAYLEERRASDSSSEKLTFSLLSPSSFARFAAYQVSRLL